MNYNFYMPTRLFTGENCLLQNADVLTQLGKRCLVVTGASSAKKSGSLTDIKASLDRHQIAYSVFELTDPMPTFDLCLEGARSAREFGANFLIGTGGGTVMDATKAVAILAQNPFISEENFYASDYQEILPFALVGTTSGSGSEVTHTAGISTSQGRKKILRSPLLFPTISFVDPRYTYTLSEADSISAALNAFSNALESYFSKTSNETGEMFALNALSLLYPPLFSMKRFGFSSVDRIQRESLQKASIYAGFSINETGTCYPHTLSYYLTDHYSLPPGLACGVFLPSFLDWVEENVPAQKVAHLEKVLDIDSLEPLKELVNYYTRIGLSLGQQDVNEMILRATNSRGVINTPGPFGQAALTQILHTLFLPEDPSFDLS